MGSVTRLLIRTCNAEFSRRMQRIQLQGMLEGVNRLRILLDLHQRRAKKVPAVGIVGIDLGNAAKGLDRALRIVGIFVQQTQAEPGMRIVWRVLAGSLEEPLRR